MNYDGQIELLNFVNNSQEESTHFTFFGPRKEWSIKSGSLELFWSQYCTWINDEVHYETKLSIAEIPKTQTPILAECKFRFTYITNQQSTSNEKNHNSCEPYDNKFVAALVACYQQSIEKYFHISDNSAELICCVLEPSENYNEHDELIVQFKLQFPYCRGSNKIQKMVRSHVITLAKQHNIFSLLSQQPKNDWEDIISVMALQEPWPLYGSVKTQTDPILDELTIYRQLPMKIDYDPDDHILELKDVFAINDNGHINVRHVSPNFFEDEDIMLYKPLFLSLNYWIGATETKDINDYQSNRSENSNNMDDFSPINIVRTLIHYIDHSYVNQKSSWLAIGKAIHKTFDGSDEGLKLWINFSLQEQRNNNQIEDDCRLLYPSFRQYNNFTLKTIAWYAKKSDPQHYDEWHKLWIEPAMEKALDGTDTTLIEAFYRCYWLDFCCVSGEKRIWYQYIEHHWIKLDKALRLRQTMSNTFRRKFEQYRVELAIRTASTNDQGAKDRLEYQIRAVGKIIPSLCMARNKNNYVTEAMERFKDDNFLKAADQDPNLTGVLNGVIETTDDHAFFRDGKPEDYITKHADIYWENYSWDAKPVKMFMEWMNKCFVDDELRDFFFRFIASGLKSGNADKISAFFTGSGNNSKSAVKKLLELIFGPYTHTFPTSAFTQTRRSASGPNPEIALAKDTKFSFLQEPETESPFKGGFFKEIVSGCGGDGMFVRLLHDNGGVMKPTFILIIICNEIPTFTGSGEALEGRVMIVPFLSKWNKNAPTDEREQFRQRVFKMDRYFNLKIPYMAAAALWVFVQKYADYCKLGLKKPDIVIKTTEDYWAENDVYMSFVRENIQLAIIPGSKNNDNPDGRQDPNAKITLSDIYKSFRTWHRDNYNTTTPDKNVFKREMSSSKRLGRLHTDDAWHGVQLIIPMAMGMMNGTNMAHV